MTKRLLVLGMVLIALFSLAGLASCLNDEEKNMSTITFALGNKTTDYFDVGGRGQLLKMIKSADELAQLLEEKQISISPTYDAAFFETKTLALYFITANIYNDLTLEISTIGDTLRISPKYDMPGGTAMEAERSWTFFIEIASEDLLGISKVEIK